MVIILTFKIRALSRPNSKKYATLARKAAQQPRCPRNQEEAWGIG
jgi:hypothetical protein